MIKINMNFNKQTWRHTKIIATIGPSSSSAESIEKLIQAGIDIVRLNLSHGDLKQHDRYVKLIRDKSRQRGKNIAILLDLPGPKYRIGQIKNGHITLKKGDKIKLTSKNIEGDNSIIPVNLPYLTQDAIPGDTILLADGTLELRVEAVHQDYIQCKVLTGGELESGKGVVIPRRHISAPYITDSMKEYIHFANEQKPDFIALSFVSDAGDINEVKRILREEHAEIPVIAKIEREEALANFNRILMVSDGIMVARGDLGVEIPLERVPLVQKDLIMRCNRAGKPVITATEMLESMVNVPRPTRAEATDVANAIFDGTDAVMLSAETAIGKYPAQAVAMMAKIAREVEKVLPYEKMLIDKNAWIEPETDELISYNACHTAHRLHASAIVAYTQSGSTARRVSKYRPKVPVLALTPSASVYRQLILCWGVYPMMINMPSNLDEIFATAKDCALETGMAKSGDLIVITAGVPTGLAGTTNLLKVERVD